MTAFPGTTGWIIFFAIAAVLILADLLLTRRSHRVSYREAVILTIITTAIGLGLSVWIFISGDTQLGVEYLSAYIAERALSIDNVFVFFIIFSFFALPDEHQPRALLIGIIGALVARGIFILVGAALIQSFSVVLFVLGAFLIYTAYKIWRQDDSDKQPDKNIVVRAIKKVVPFTDDYDGTKWFTRRNGALVATPFFLIIVALIATDIFFAVDSIPTVFGISSNLFIVWSSNVMAVLGMRPLYFLIAGLVQNFRFLQHGLAIILAFVGVKIIINESLHTFTDLEHLPGITPLWESFISLGVIILILAGSIVLSALFPKKDSTHAPS